MALPENASNVASAIRLDVSRSTSRAKRLKLRTLLGKFGYSKRSDANTADITRVLSDAGISLNPPIVRFGDAWGISTEDWIYLSDAQATPQAPLAEAAKFVLSSVWNADGWFDRLAGLEVRTEREVETKFMIPLLSRLGYNDDDRFDGMTVPAANGSRGTTLVIDCAVFNTSLESLRSQPLLVIEAKRENRLVKRTELAKAHNQAKSYCLWTQCQFYMVTDSRTLHAYHIARGCLNGLSPVFSCERHELKDRFKDLFALVSRDALTKHYLAKLSTTDEAR